MYLIIIYKEEMRVRELGVREMYKKGSSETIQVKQNIHKHVSEANSLLERETNKKDVSKTNTVLKRETIDFM